MHKAVRTSFIGLNLEEFYGIFNCKHFDYHAFQYETCGISSWRDKDGNGRRWGILMARAFELSQTLKDKWATADIAEKRLILELMCLNLTLKDATLEITMRKPFDQLAEGLKMNIGSGGRI